MAAVPQSVVMAVDVSGSTYGQQLYWERVGSVLEGLGGSAFNGRIILWDHTAWDTDLQNLQLHIDTELGLGGTNPSSIVSFVCKDGGQLGSNVHLVVLTDGDVSLRAIDALDAELTRCASAFSPAEVTCHLIGSSANLSVSCAFTRDVPHSVYHHVDDCTAGEVVMSMTDADRSILHQLEDITTIQQFVDALPALTRAVTVKTLGTTGCNELKTRVLQLRKRLLADQGSKASQGTPAVQQLSDALSVGDLTAALTNAGAIAAQFYGEGSAVWSKKVDRLIAMCDGSLRDCLQPSRLQRHEDQDAPVVVSETDGQQVAEMTPEAVPFVCPVTLDEENDAVLLLRQPSRPLLEALREDSKAALDAVLNCPLAALGRTDFIKTLLDHIDHPVSLVAVKASPNGFSTSPLTRAPLIASQIPGMCLSAHPEHASATDHALALLLAGGKRPGNLDLWFAVVLLAVESDACPEYLCPLAPQLRRHMQYRLQHRRSAASLTGLADMVTTRLPLGVACWFVLAGALLPGVRLDDARDPLRPHIFHSDALRRLVEVAGFEVPEGAARHALRLKALAALLSASKKNVNALRSRLRALHQASVVVRRSVAHGAAGVGGGAADGAGGAGAGAAGTAAAGGGCEEEEVVFIPLDGPASDEQVLRARASLLAMCRMSRAGGDGRGGDEEELTIAELAGLGAMVHPGLTMGSIRLPGDWQAPPVSAAVVEWPEYSQERYDTRMKDMVVDICEATCRPLYRPGGRVWREVAVEKTGIAVEEMISLTALFARFVLGKGRYPAGPDSVGELVMFVYDRVRRSAKGKTTLPCCVVEMVGNVLREFEGVMGRMDAGEFASRFTASTLVVVRQQMEADPGLYERLRGQESESRPV